jgi:hypothetical protein
MTVQDHGHILLFSAPRAVTGRKQDLEEIKLDLQCSICHDLLVDAVKCEVLYMNLQSGFLSL